jgi:hypothetical protein
MHLAATHVRLGQLVTPTSAMWALLLWDDGSKPVDFTALGMHLSGKSIEEVKEAAESMLTEQGYRVRGVRLVPQGWCAAWGIIHEGETIDVEVVAE